METNDKENKDELKSRKWCVYMHTNKLNGKRYIGITSQNPIRRWGTKGTKYKKNKHFWAAIQKYGWNNFKHEIILYDEIYEYACAVEKCLIRHYKSNLSKYGYNQSIGGDKASLGKKLSDETKRKLSEANKGKVMPQEVRDKISQTEKGRVFPDDVKKKISKGLKGRVLSDESRKKMSDAKKGKGTTEVYCVELNMTFNSLKNAQKYTNVCYQSISMCCRDEIQSAGGYHWRYTQEAKRHTKKSNN